MALTNEIIGLVLIASVIVVVLVARHLLLATRRTQGSLTDTTLRPETPQTGTWPLEPAASVMSGFGSVPVWAGGSPADTPAGPPRRGDPKPPALHPAQETPVTEGTGDDPPRVEVVAVPGNSAHASRVMHVSSLRAPVASDMPTAWMVVTPMDLLGDRPPGATSAPIAAAVPTPVTEHVSEPTAPPEVEQPEPPPHEELILVTPNPFGPTKDLSPQVDLSMPSSLLADLLGSEAPVGE
jgi:hypothetical protein